MSDSSGKATRVDTSYALAAGVGFLLSGVLLLVSIFAFRPEKPVVWPPASRVLAVVAFGIAGTLFTVLLLALVWLAVYLIAILAHRRTWRGLARRMLQALIVVVMTGAGIRVALSAFYWPWALASAVQTVHSNPPKWRLVSCGRLLADRWSDEVDAALTEGIESRTEEVQAAVAYVLAGTGEKSALVRLVHIAQSMPSVSAETPAEPAIEERGISSQEDVLWLVAGLTDTEYGSLAEFTGQEGADLAALVWDPRKGRYIHAGQGAQE